MSQPKFSEVLRAAANGIRKQYSAQGQAQYFQAGTGQTGFGRMYGPGEYGREQQHNQDGLAKADMFDSIAELYEKYEQAQHDQNPANWAANERSQMEQMKRE